MEIELRHQALRMVVVDKGSIGLLDEFWVTRGVYFLLGHGTDPERYTAYVGKAPSGLISRINNHVRNREDPWQRALLVASSTSTGLDSAAIGWLEGRLYDLLDVAPAAQLLNRNRPRDESLPLYDREVLEQYVTPIAAALRALGYPPDTPDQLPPEPSRRTRQSVDGSVADLVSGGFLRAGTRLRSTRQNDESVATVLDDGRLEVGGEIFESPSSAGRHVLGRNVNGWEFWGAPSGDGSLIALERFRERLTSEGPKSIDPSPEGAPAPAPQAATNGPARTRGASSSISLSDLIAAGLIPRQGRLSSHFRGGGHEAHYDGDAVTYEGTVFRSPSAAGAAAIGGAVNGWAFWHVDRAGRAVSLAELRSELAAR